MHPYQNYTSHQYRDLRCLYQAAARRFADSPAILQPGQGATQACSYHRLAEQIDALGTELLARGLGGRTILLLGTGGIPWTISFFAAACIGSVIPVEPSCTSAQLRVLCRITEASALLYDRRCAKRLGDLPPTSPLRLCLDALPRLIHKGEERMARGDRRYWERDIDPHSTCLILFDAAREPGVMLSHRNLCFAASEVERMLHLTPRDHVLTALPTHSAFTTVCGILCPMASGGRITYANDTDALMPLMQGAQPSILLCTPQSAQALPKRLGRQEETPHYRAAPTVLRLIAPLPPSVRRTVAVHLQMQARRAPERRLRLILTAGALSDPLTSTALGAYGIPILQSHPRNECSGIVTLNRDRTPRADSVGTPPPGTLLDVWNADENGMGEIRVRGDHVMQGYFKDAGRTASVLRQGWFYTGEIGYLGEDGALSLIGNRENEMITRDGGRVFPEELERLLRKSPLVCDVAIVTPPHATEAHSTVAPIALIYPRHSASLPSQENRFLQEKRYTALSRVISEVNAALPPHKQIASFLISDTPFPKDACGKLLRNALDEIAVDLASTNKSNLP